MSITLRKKYPIIILTGLFSIIFIVKVCGIIINITPSMKKGIYVRTYGAIQRGDIVAVCLGEPYKTIGLKNLYIQQGTKCDGAVPVIKKVIAIPGDDVELFNDSIKINNQVFPFKTATQDSSGRVLRSYPRGHYANTQGYWLIGTNSPDSWDSRYWGAVQKQQLLFKLKLLNNSRHQLKTALRLPSLHPRPQGQGFTAVLIKSCGQVILHFPKNLIVDAIASQHPWAA